MSDIVSPSHRIPSAATQTKRGWLVSLRRALAVPAVRFVVLGALLFAAHAYVRQREALRLVLSPAEQAALRARFVQERGRPPDAAEQRALWERWAQQEALVRHARELELDQHDAVVRRRLIQDVEFLLEAEAPLPTRAELVAYYEAHRERYAAPASCSFEQVFVADSGDGANERAEALRSELVRGAPAGELGDPSVHGTAFSSVSEERLTALYGADFAASVFALAPGVWSPPLASRLGLHLVRVGAQTPAALRPFDEVSSLVTEHHAEDARRSALERGRRSLRDRYRLEVE